MDHVKELELQVLLKFREVGGKVIQSDFDNVFPVNTAEMRAIMEGLEIDKYISHGFFSTQNNSTATHNVITERGKTRIIQLQKEQDEEEAAKHEGKEVSTWTIIAGIGGGIAAIPVIIEFVKWIISLFHK
jgi:hypothetical protein